MIDRFIPRILQYLADRRYQPQSVNELADELGISPEDRGDFKLAVHQLVDEDQVILSPSNALTLPPPGRTMIGVFRLNRRGFGFIVPDSATEHGDLFVPAGSTGGALSGDRVKAKVVHEQRRAKFGRSPYTGKIIDILQRADKKYVGNLVQKGPKYFVDVDGHALPNPVIIRDPHAKNAKPGDKVVVELLSYPEEDHPGEGVITQVLGDSGEPDVETTAIIHTYSLPGPFDSAVIAAAREAAKTFNDSDIPEDREDLTGELVCTIDPPDARDFDDAISINKLDPRAEKDNAAWELGVHIADVAHFVTRGSPLDVEAQKRGNSVYLPRVVIPMLPEVLSNGVCSLQEGVNRFTRSAIMRYDDEGNLVSERLARTVIRSAKRLTYLEAQALIEDDIREARKHTRSEPKYPSVVIQALKRMDELARVIRKRRFKDGMIVLDLPDVDLVFDDSGRVIDAVPEDDAFTHKIIEAFMVEANEAAARLFDKMDTPMLRRIHPDPPTHDMTDLRQFARVAGFHIPAKMSAHALQQLLDATRGKPSQHAVHKAVLQTLSRAEYSPLLIGHFALASEHYTHFTSPIRRYPDLVVHRGLDAYFEARDNAGQGGKRNKGSRRISKQMADDPRLMSEEELVALGRHCSGTERNAEAAERDLRTYLVLDFLSERLGDDYEGTVTGISNEGLYVQLDKYLVDGFIRSADLPPRGDHWRLNRVTGALIAQRSGRSINIGDQFIVRIARVLPARRQLDLAIVKDPKAATTSRRNKSVKTGVSSSGQNMVAKNKKKRTPFKGPKRKPKGRGRRSR